MDLLIEGWVNDHRTTYALEEMILGLLLEQWKFMIVQDCNIVLKSNCWRLNTAPRPAPAQIHRYK